ncbi:hypothetical protein A2363_04395 [Candidatus Gottesmanbacteria bacterium RIFOXYB1_FULL_47_11]|uniref:HTH crp-type domain-containing protein n=1 Tax=Candidatus Gottesmanbacteria bacterium RIFOXYB1_FULL_47_11 TaxID=1798401 RepID=A0A1F6BEQ6_9BACT|nr:MAG: hypothetical protein A2363_04395 [Candidatus Gottesmanbacteria bacterium RIFOXYB1_FULL_47_11]
MCQAPVAALTSFFEQYTRIKLKKCEIIIRADDTPQGVFFITRGYVRQYVIGTTGAVFMIHIFKPHSFFPMTWTINNTPNAYYYEAITAVELWRAPKEVTLAFLHTHPDVVYNLTSRLLLGVSGMMRRMEYLIMHDAYTRIIFLLLYLAHNLGVREGTVVVLSVPVTHREISAWVGTTRETASIHVETLKERGIIEYRKRRLVIPCMRDLETELAAYSH